MSWRHIRRATTHVVIWVVLVAVEAGCASSAALRRGNQAVLDGDWDAAVDHFREAVQEDPDDAASRIALERAMRSAADAHTRRAQELAELDELPAALSEYRRAAELDPANGRLAAAVLSLERQIRDRAEASRPPSTLERLQNQARSAAQPPLLDPASDEPLTIQFRNAALSDILDFLGSATGINVTYDQTFQDRTYSVQLVGVTLEEALDQILTATENFYKVLNPRGLIVVPDTPPKRAQYEEQVIRTFFVSHADVTELTTMLVQVVRAPTLAVQPSIVANPASHTITIRATTAIADVIERVIAANDKPRAEIVVDVEILEVNRDRARAFGLDLSSYSIGAVFSPSGPPAGGSDPDAAASSAFNANLLSGGVSASDFYLAVPSAVINFLETDEETRLVAKPQLRGQEGSELTLNLGDDIPVPSTSFTAIATGGVAVNPLTSFEYRPIGVNLIMTPRVTYEDEIILELEVENSTLGPNINVAGQALPTFGTRKVVTTLRLRDGESNLLAGLLREEDRRSLRGFPGILHLPVIRQLFSANEDSIKQTDIVMLLTPRIVRTHELTEEDVSPIFIGTQQNMGVTGPPPLIAPVAQARPMLAEPAGAPDAPGLEPPAGPPPLQLLASPGGPAPPGARIGVTGPGTDLVTGSGPYTVPISIRGASQVSTLSLTVTFDPAMLRVRTVQEGSFMRQGIASVTFAHQVDAAAGRIDLALSRGSDGTGAAGEGIVAAIVFDPVGPGQSTIAPSGIAMTPAGAPLTLDFESTLVHVR